MQEQVTESLFDVPDREVTIETTADVIKPMFRFVKPLVNEFKLNLATGGINVNVVDPSNVSMATLDVPAEAFEDYDGEGTTVGINTDSLMRGLRAGRMGSQDEIRLEISGDYLKSTIDREYSGTAMSLQNRMALIDPDHIRQEPDVPTDLDIQTEAKIPIDAFDEAIKQASTIDDYVSMEAKDGNLCFAAASDTDSSGAILQDVVEGENAESIYSLGYIKMVRQAYKRVKADDVTIRFGTEFPAKFEGTTELNGTNVDLMYMVAPRIQS